jgi:hypothetical protein
MKPPTTSEVLEITNNEISLFLFSNLPESLVHAQNPKSLVMKDLESFLERCSI